MKKNDIITIEISGMTADGNGVGRYEQMAVFVNETAVGETVEAHVIKVYKNYAIAKLIKVITPSKDRIESDCPVSSACGGCSFRHISYQAECEIKYNKVADSLSRIGGLSILPDELVSAENICAYRNKAQYPATLTKDGKVTFGFFANHTHRVVENQDCALQPECFSKILKAVANWANENNISVYNEQTGKGILRHVYLRKAQKCNEICVVIVINSEILPAQNDLINALKQTKENIVSIQYNINKQKTNVILGKTCKTVFGKSFISDIICGIKVNISPLSFYQVNRDMAEKLYQKAQEFAGVEGKTVIDLYCGVGTIGLTMAKKAKKIIGVEIVPEAIEDAKINAINNGIENAEFIAADATAAAEMLANRGVQADVVILDPPRKGCTPELIETVSKKFSPNRVVYVSCDPATLARDLKLFEQMGYTTVSVTPFDLFPRTSHVENVCLLIKK